MVDRRLGVELFRREVVVRPSPEGDAGGLAQEVFGQAEVAHQQAFVAGYERSWSPGVGPSVAAQ